MATPSSTKNHTADATAQDLKMMTVKEKSAGATGGSGNASERSKDVNGDGAGSVPSSASSAAVSDASPSTSSGLSNVLESVASTSDGSASAGADVRGASTSTSLTSQYPELTRSVQEIKERLDQNKGGGRRAPRAAGAAAESMDQHQFWSTQPVPRFDEKVPATTNDAIETKSVEEIRAEPRQLPAGFFWDTLDINHRGTLEEIYNLLHDNYVEDDDSMFRFRYSHEFLLWALRPPGWTNFWHVGVRVAGSNKLVSFISAVPSQIRVRGKSMKMTEVNFLCVLKKLRSKRMAVVLIQEITRRCNVRGIFQAAFTAGKLLPTPVGTCRYWHRSIHPAKLVDVGFSSIPPKSTLQRMKKLYKVDEEGKLPGFRPAEAKDVPAIHDLLTTYLKQFEMAPEFELEEVAHYFMPQDKIIYAYVVEDPATGKLTDFTSFYSLPSTVVDNPKYDSIYAAYSFYNVATKTSWRDLIMASIVMAKKEGFDVFNALDLMENTKFLKDLAFGIGDGSLNYYLFNWKCPEMQPGQIGLVLM
ncbi:Glycylpeptide N-tetradecanoyltransferase 2 [Hypsibius exemplaris]|uniref:Glycylpeptide N-tetradecanoyltransferase n=1 Tax=Hypsibius exemplaris TaxID=2072580 RepID=A0A1W0WJJ7_HYPEX|nr:Glycylpeptide N-tetradecanoyltransferase 2 [Hypsibius exemplaris]